MNPMELAWLALSVLGLFYGWRNLRESSHDLVRAKEMVNNLRAARLLVANGYVYRNRIRVLIFAWWALIGVMFSFFEPPDIPRAAGVMGLVATVAGWSLIGLQEDRERASLRRIVGEGQVADSAVTAADKVVRKAEITAAKLEGVAQEAALQLRERTNHTLEQAAERTAENTERIAENTERLVAEPDDGREP